jgi:hypothetical protein
VNVSEGRIPDMSKGDFDFIGTIIETERERIRDGFPEMFRTINKKLIVVLLDFRDCPPTKSLLSPENFNFCEHHDSKPLVERWNQARRDMDTLIHPMVLFCVRVQRGPSSLPILRFVPITSTDESGQVVLYKGDGCSC